MNKRMIRVASAQINPTVGDLRGNADKILFYIDSARSRQADIVCFPELALTGYPPEDLLLKPGFVTDAAAVMRRVVARVKGIVAVIGTADKVRGGLSNSAVVAAEGRIKGVCRKMLLPNYGVFDEKRYFVPGEGPFVFALGRFLFGVNICEDIWHENGPTAAQAEMGARVILNINASPYHMGKLSLREKIVCRQARRNDVHVLYTNLVGGQDELVFDGQSIAVDPGGRIIARSTAIKEDILTVEFPVEQGKLSRKTCRVYGGFVPRGKTAGLDNTAAAPLSGEEEVYGALVLGLRDYVHKNGFNKTVIGLSGGIDSALVAALAADALGKENVTGIFMPSRYSSADSEEDARALARNLGIRYESIGIERVFADFLSLLEPHFSGMPKDITEENMQARLRGMILMAFSNKFGWLVLTTGNKSEMSTGYATLYGDMAGGLAVIKDVPKMLVYSLCRYRNGIGEVIPERIMTKAPTAELRENQKDSDSLPPYDVLDRIVAQYVEEDVPFSRIVKSGFDAATVRRVAALVDKSEYKRRQSPPGLKITPRAFGRDRRMPITNKYSEAAYGI